MAPEVTFSNYAYFVKILYNIDIREVQKPGVSFWVIQKGNISRAGRGWWGNTDAFRLGTGKFGENHPRDYLSGNRFDGKVDIQQCRNIPYQNQAKAIAISP